MLKKRAIILIKKLKTKITLHKFFNATKIKEKSFEKIETYTTKNFQIHRRKTLPVLQQHQDVEQGLRKSAPTPGTTQAHLQGHIQGALRCLDLIHQIDAQSQQPFPHHHPSQEPTGPPI
jgi:hypothetical protein